SWPDLHRFVGTAIGEHATTSLARAVCRRRRLRRPITTDLPRITALLLQSITIAGRRRAGADRLAARIEHQQVTDAAFGVAQVQRESGDAQRDHAVAVAKTPTVAATVGGGSGTYRGLVVEDRRVDAHLGVLRLPLADQVARRAFGIDEVVVLPIAKIKARQAQRRTHRRTLLGLQPPRFGRLLEDFKPRRQRRRCAS